jgi:hypothetical protein
MGDYKGSYDPSQVSVSIGLPVGPLGVAVTIPNLPPGLAIPWILGGWAPDSFVMAERAEDAVTSITGADGETCDSVSANENGSITLTLMDSSVSNTVLSLLLKAFTNRLTPVRFVFPVTITDASSLTTVAFSQYCTVRKVAPLARGAQTGTNEWTLNAPNLEIFHAGRVF